MSSSSIHIHYSHALVRGPSVRPSPGTRIANVQLDGGSTSSTCSVLHMKCCPLIGDLQLIRDCHPLPCLRAWMSPQDRSSGAHRTRRIAMSVASIDVTFSGSCRASFQRLEKTSWLSDYFRSHGPSWRSIQDEFQPPSVPLALLRQISCFRCSTRAGKYATMTVMSSR